MKIISSNQYLKTALQSYLDVRFHDLLKNRNTLVLDFSFQCNLHAIDWNEHDKIIVLTDDMTDALLFNNIKINAPIHFVQINVSLNDFFNTFSIALQSAPGRCCKQMMTLKRDLLSNRQFVVLALTANGLSLPQISLALGLSTKMLSGYRTSALKRINKRLNLITFSKLQILTANMSFGKHQIGLGGYGQEYLQLPRHVS